MIKCMSLSKVFWTAMLEKLLTFIPKFGYFIIMGFSFFSRATKVIVGLSSGIRSDHACSSSFTLIVGLI